MKTNKFYIGIFWFLGSLVLSMFNDSITKYMGMRLHPFEVAFFRFLFSVLTLLPFIIKAGTKSLKSDNLHIHIARGSLLFLGLAGWSYALTKTYLGSATVISFTIPFFFLILASFFLQERVTWYRWFSTILGFLGILFISGIHTQEFNPYVLIYVISSIMFASIDILNKKFVLKESMMVMLFYSALVTSLLALPFALYFWITPTASEIGYLFLLGISANLILYCLLKAFALVDATALNPFRYLEIVFSIIVSFVFFKEVPSSNFIYGASIIVLATIFNIYNESTQIEKQN